jgi:putative ABC transport system permease protein
MLRNYLITALRNLLRNPLYALINILGLSIGITCSLVILLFIKHEFSYDRFHDKKDEIYRLVIENVSPERSVMSPQTIPPVGPAMVEEFPEVIRCTRFSYGVSGFYSYDEGTFREEKVLFADSSLFRMFSFRLLLGDPDRALVEPFSVVISDQTAERIFGEENPVGEILRWNNLYSV